MPEQEFEFISKEAFVNARNLIQKMAYRKTFEEWNHEEIGKYGDLRRFNFDISSGHSLTLKPEIYHIDPEELKRLEEVEEVKSIRISDVEGICIRIKEEEVSRDGANE